MTQKRALAPPPPVREGVGPSRVSLPPGLWPTFLDFLTARFPGVAAGVWQQRMAAGLVIDAFGQAVRGDQAYAPQNHLYYYRDLHLPGGEKRLAAVAPIVWKDAHLVVADKPHFLAVTPVGAYVQESLLVRLKNSLQIDTLVPLHRIDRDTAGLVLFCVIPAERDAYQQLFRQRSMDKQYEAIAPLQVPSSKSGAAQDGWIFPLTRNSRIEPGEPFFRQREVPGTPNSQTHIALLEQQGRLGRYRLNPVTGKKHQLRVHMQALGLPIENDRMYGCLAALPLAETEADNPARPLQLLAQALAFTDPVTGEKRHFESGFSLDFGLCEP